MLRLKVSVDVVAKHFLFAAFVHHLQTIYGLLRHKTSSSGSTVDVHSKEGKHISIKRMCESVSVAENHLPPSVCISQDRFTRM